MEQLIKDLRIVGNTIRAQWGQHPNADICHLAADVLEGKVDPDNLGDEGEETDPDPTPEPQPKKTTKGRRKTGGK